MGNSKKTLVGIDIGGTKIAAVLFMDGKVIEAVKVPTPKNKKNFFKAVESVVHKVAREHKFHGVGIGIAGAVDAKNGVVKSSPNLKFLKNTPVGKILQKNFKKSVRIDNDTNCFLRGEYHFGQAKGKTPVVALTLGTGVGGAVMVNGELIRGRNTSGGELGHIRILKEKGRYLSLEHLVSGKGFSRLGIKDPLACQLKAEKGDKKAIKIYNEVGEYLGVGIASLINIFDPQVVILGGGISRANKLLTEPAKKIAKEYVISSLKNNLPPIKISNLKHAAELGAVSLFF